MRREQQQQQARCGWFGPYPETIGMSTEAFIRWFLALQPSSDAHPFDQLCEEMQQQIVDGQIVLHRRGDGSLVLFFGIRETSVDDLRAAADLLPLERPIRSNVLRLHFPTGGEPEGEDRRAV